MNISLFLEDDKSNYWLRMDALGKEADEGRNWLRKAMVRGQYPL